MESRWAPSEAGVSAREAEVLAALGEHLTNAEIGARLLISIRTVESHVSSLLRKLQVVDRRALAAVAAPPNSVPTPRPDVATTVAAPLPSPLTPFVGRVADRAALTAALHDHRLVTAVGPGGVGKTRLALRVAADVAGRFADGVWYVDLVPVTDALMIAPAIADALGLGERQGRSATDNVLGWLAERETLFVLDNCEHLLDGVVVLVERLLAGITDANRGSASDPAPQTAAMRFSSSDLHVLGVTGPCRQTGLRRSHALTELWNPTGPAQVRVPPDSLGEVMGPVEPVGHGVDVGAAGGGNRGDQPQCAGDTAHRSTTGRINIAGTVGVVGGEVVGGAGREVFPDAGPRVGNSAHTTW